MIRYLINAETPAKKNANKISFKTKRTYKSKGYVQWHELAYMTLISKVKECIGTPIKDEKGKVVSQGKCYILLTFTHGDYVRRDADNGTSSIFDLLQDVNQLFDDNWKIVKSHHVFNTYQKGNPSCEIRIYKPEEKNEYLSDLIQYAEKYD